MVGGTYRSLQCVSRWSTRWWGPLGVGIGWVSEGFGWFLGGSEGTWLGGRGYLLGGLGGLSGWLQRCVTILTVASAVTCPLINRIGIDGSGLAGAR